MLQSSAEKNGEKVEKQFHKHIKDTTDAYKMCQLYNWRQTIPTSYRCSQDFSGGAILFLKKLMTFF